MPIAAAMANPTTSRFRLSPTSDRNSEVGQMSHACSATSLAVGTRNESSAPRPELPDAQGGEKDEHAERGPDEAARRGRPHCADRSSPDQKSVRR